MPALRVEVGCKHFSSPRQFDMTLGQPRAKTKAILPYQPPAHLVKGWVVSSRAQIEIRSSLFIIIILFTGALASIRD